MSTLKIPTPTDFHFPSAVSSYGYYMLAPNQWDPQGLTLDTVLRDGDGNSIGVRIEHIAGRSSQNGGDLRLTCSHSLSRTTQRMFKSQVARMLRVDEDLTGFHRICPAARRAKFGRLIRSATLFEDIVKTITGCNVAWSSTITMNRLMCEHVGAGGFPTPAQLATWEPADLKATVKVGYRAERIVRLARAVDAGELDLAAMEDPTLDGDELHRRLLAIYGIGEYAAGNIRHCLGRYDRVAIDSETYRHVREKFGLTDDNITRLNQRIIERYSAFAPYSFLVYWFELWTGYQATGEYHDNA